MLSHVVRFSVMRPWTVLGAAALFLAVALHAFAGLPIEAFPDVTDPSVDVVGIYPGQASDEVERRVTLELERVLAGTARMTNLRSVSVFGLALLTLRFEDGSVDRDNRAQVAERLREARLPEGVEVSLGPQATPVGQIYRYTLRGPKPLRELRAIQDFTIERQLRAVPGVADVVTFGGYERRYEVRVDPVRLANAGVSVADVYRAIESANVNAGGGYVAIGAQEFVVRGVGAARRPEDLASALVASFNGFPLRVGDVAELVEASTPRRGAVSRGGDPDVVEGIVLLRRGENPSVVLDALRAKVDELNHGILPRGVTMETFYDRGELIDQTLHTVRENLLHGALLVLFVLYAFLRSARGAVIVTVVIPFALLSSFVGLRLLGRSANLISLGAIDFGILVDGAVVVLEASLHALGHHREEDRRHQIARVSAGVAGSVGLAMLIIIAGLAPVFLLERVEGRIFAPMAFTYAFALLGALVSAFTIVPALEGLTLADAAPVHMPRWLEVTAGYYGRALSALRAHRVVAAALIVAMLALGALIARGVGTEFLPELDEGGLYITAVLPPDVSLDEARATAPAIRARVLALPETRDVLVHIGRPEQAAQAEGPNNVEVFVALERRDRWRSGVTRKDLEDQLRARLREVPGVQYNFSQPITDRVYETISGIIGQVVVKVEGSDLDEMTRHAERIRQRLGRVAGVTDLSLYQAGETPQLAIELDRERLARNGLTVADAEQVIDIALGGKVATTVWESERRYDVALRLADSVRADPDAMGRLVIGDASRRVQLAEVADMRFLRGRAAIWRENLRRFVALKFNVRGRDLGSVIADAQRATASLAAPEGVTVRWGGEFENQRRAMRRLAVTVPPALVCILLILYWIFRRARPMAAIGAMLPIAVLGAVAGLRLAGENLSVSAAVGCVALLGQVSLAGILVCSRIDEAAARDADDPLVEGTREALRPVLLTTALAVLGLVPAATSHAMGSETQRPFAIAIVAGLVTVLPMVLFALPLLVARRADASPLHAPDETLSG